MPTLALDIFDTIGEDFFGFGVSSRSVSELLASNPDADVIKVRINSSGGDVFEGNTIFNLLKAHAAEVHVEVHGLAASMASIVALAGDTVTMAENAMFMIHNPWAVVLGNAEGMRKKAELLDKVKATLVDVYARASGKTKGKVSKMMNAETWLTAKEAKAEGFIDKVVESFESTPAANDDAAARIFATLNTFEHSPTHLVAQYVSNRGRELIAAHTTPTERKAQPKTERKQMHREALIKLLGLNAEATDEEITAAQEAFTTKQSAAPDLSTMVPRADFDQMKTQLDTLTAKNAADEAARAESAKKAFEVECASVVDAAVASAKVAPASKAYHLNSCLRGPEALDAFREYVKAAPAVVSNSQMEKAERDTQPGGKAEPLDDAARVVCRKMNISPEEFRSAQSSIREDEETYHPVAYANAR